MSVPFSNTKLRVPRGFQNILEGLAREVLRSQPEDIYTYGAIYFENLLKGRGEGGVDPASHGAGMEDRFYNNKSFQKPDVDPSNREQQDAALRIQTKYRQHNAKQVVQQKREERASVKIQSGFRGYKVRKEVKSKTDGQEGHPPQKEAPQEEEIDIDLNDPEVEGAAIKIQAGFKGMKARKEVKAEKEPQATPMAAAPEQEEEIDIDLNDPEVEKAATKIQAGFKGLKARQELKARKSEENQNQNNQAAAEEPIDIDLNDPEVEKAATKIQAGFKGHKARKEVKQMKESGQEEKPTATGDEEVKKEGEEEKVDIDLNDPEVEKAASKIQAGFKGYKARKDLKEKQSSDDQ